MTNKERVGYGHRIYKKRKSPLPYVFIVLALAAAFFIFNHIRAKNESEFQEYARLEAARVDVKPEMGEDEISVLEEDGGDDPLDSNEATTFSPEPAPTNPDAPGINQNDDSKKMTQPLYSPQDQNSLIEAGEYFAKRDYNKALGLYLDAIPQNQTALVYAGMCYYWLKDYGNALDYFEKAIEYNKMDFMARKYIAFTHYNLDELDDARVAVKEAMAIMKDGELAELKTKLMEEERVMDRYTDTTTTKFKILFSKTEHQEVERLILDHLNEAYREVGRQLDFYPQQPVTVILYNEKDFFDVTRSPGWAGGLYDGKIRLPIKGMSSSSDILKRILVHEYTHALVHTVSHNCPRWIDEGLAEYFSEENLPEIGQVIPLQNLENGFPGDEELVMVAYVESYCAVNYLVERYGFYRMKELLKSLGSGNNIKTAFKEVLMTPYETFLRDWGKD